MEVHLRVADQEPGQHRRHVPEVPEMACAARPAHDHPVIPARGRCSFSRSSWTQFGSTVTLRVVLAYHVHQGLRGDRHQVARCDQVRGDVPALRQPVPQAALMIGGEHVVVDVVHQAVFPGHDSHNSMPRGPVSSCPANTSMLPGVQLRVGQPHHAPLGEHHVVPGPAELGQGLVAAVVAAPVRPDRQPEDLHSPRLRGIEPVSSAPANHASMAPSSVAISGFCLTWSTNRSAQCRAS